MSHGCNSLSEEGDGQHVQYGRPDELPEIDDVGDGEREAKSENPGLPVVLPTMGRRNSELDVGMLHEDAALHLLIDVAETCRFETGRLIGESSGLSKLQPADWAYFGAPRAILCDIDYVGALYCGALGDGEDISTARKSKRYITEVMSVATGNRGYEHFGEHLYNMYRHGTVHLRQPKRFENPLASTRFMTWTVIGPSSETLPLEAGVSHNLRHLAPMQLEPDLTTLPLSIQELFDDFFSSLDHFAGQLRSEAQRGETDLLRRWRSAADRLVNPEQSRLNW